MTSSAGAAGMGQLERGECCGEKKCEDDDNIAPRFVPPISFGDTVVVSIDLAKLNIFAVELNFRFGEVLICDVVKEVLTWLVLCIHQGTIFPSGSRSDK